VTAPPPNAVRSADGVIFVTPEYNYGIPGGASRTRSTGLSRIKDSAVQGQAGPRSSRPPAARWAVGRMQYQLRQAMVFLNAFTFNTPEIFVGSGAHQVRRLKWCFLDEGRHQLHQASSSRALSR